jgi:hypothetical protein
LFIILRFKMMNKLNKMTKALAYKNKKYNYRFEIFSHQTHCVIYALYLQFEVINWWTSDTLKNVLAYSHKRVNYNLNFFYSTGPRCNSLFMFTTWALKMINKWSTNTLAYNHKIFNYNPKTYYYTGVMFNYWNDEQVKHWHTR